MQGHVEALGGASTTLGPRRSRSVVDICSCNKQKKHRAPAPNMIFEGQPLWETSRWVADGFSPTLDDDDKLKNN
ncbi:hypothetical protein CEXT_799851 [Caerostris extrusa]|uniref:Uncharacterized protein n=1 Tax=Caerostris extrusa TaxID=172846 RepID=A0AAV4U024_CAEEX|nr:hypothetical protein CEXT_799851 [Caerostris extrusa]